MPCGQGARDRCTKELLRIDGHAVLLVHAMWTHQMFFLCMPCVQGARDRCPKELLQLVPAQRPAPSSVTPELGQPSALQVCGRGAFV
jgi:hypothetical protein